MKAARPIAPPRPASCQITRALRLELNGTGIRVSTVDPGLAETEFSLVRFKGDADRARRVYEGTQPLTPEDIAEIMVWVASRPPHVNIDEMLVRPVDQAAAHKVYGGNRSGLNSCRSSVCISFHCRTAGVVAATLGPTRTGLAFSTAAAASLTISLPATAWPGLAVPVPVVVPRRR